MKYELALKLKEAGFPQRELEEGDFTLCQHNNGDIHEIDESCEHVVIPSLSELIEACKEDFHSLHRLVHRPLEQERWQVRGVKTKSTEHIVYGSTSEEAIANLYLALNNK